MPQSVLVVFQTQVPLEILRCPFTAWALHKRLRLFGFLLPFGSWDILSRLESGPGEELQLDGGGRVFSCASFTPTQQVAHAW